MAESMFRVLFTTAICSYAFIFTTTVAMMDMEELKSVYYGLDILNEPVLLNKDATLGAVHVTSKYGQQYQCSFPDHSEEEKKREEEEKVAMETGIIEMLKPLGHKECLFKSKDWWSYEFCYGKFIRQFHMEDGEMKGNVIYLGHYEEDFDWTNETARENRLQDKSTVHRYHSQTYNKGTKCDLTGKPRTAEVRFMCEENSEDYLARVDEAETCVYTVVVMTSRICRHPYLRAPARRRSVVISCNPALTEEQFDEYMIEKEEEIRRQAELIAAAKARYDKKKIEETEESLSSEEVLEKEMSKMAKDLLSQPILDELFRDHETRVMKKEDFEKMFGSDEKLWELYLRGTDVRRNRQARTQELRRTQKIIQAEKEGSDGQKVTIENEDEEDEDDELIAEYQQEIESIKREFQLSQSKQLSALKTKLALEKSWESELENAIKEAEDELGVKVDRSLISGLSNTLDKLVNKLHDTQAELQSMDKELGSLIEEEEEKKKKKVSDGETAEEEEEDEEEDDQQSFGGGGGPQEDHENLSDDTETSPFSSQTESAKSSGRNDLNDKILPPPKTRGESDPIQPTSRDAPRDNQGQDFRPSEPGPQKGEMTAAVQITVNYLDVDKKEADDEEEEEEEKIEGREDEEKEEEEKKVIDVDKLKIPENVQKLLEDSVRKEFERKKSKTDSQNLRFDADHSFHQDKTVHVIQHEDKDGKTNRYIFVFGFDTFNDESTEHQKQSKLEENYAFVYGGNKREKRSSSPPLS